MWWRGMPSHAPRQWRGGASRESRRRDGDIAPYRQATRGRRHGDGAREVCAATGYGRGHAKPHGRCARQRDTRGACGMGKGGGWWMRRDSNPQPFGVDPKSTAYASSATHPRYQLCAKRKECRVLSARGAFLRNAKTILKEGRNGQGKPFGAGMCGGRSCMSGKKQVQSFHHQKRLEDASRVQIIGRKA